ncbi:hypothetical protein [Chitinophaga polysaccharea]|uniref:hypothetical protein n=1 Tax=Chitinophaga polysaccharea TaxID=1293035 RepID=UPI001157A095|nr:hypothetical protein [Chitinophaga polysaccharea]
MPVTDFVSLKRKLEKCGAGNFIVAGINAQQQTIVIAGICNKDIVPTVILVSELPYCMQLVRVTLSS